MNCRLFCLGLIVILILASGCSSSADPTATPQPEPTAEPEPTAGPVVLELVGPDGTQSMSMAELKALPAAQGWAGGKSSTGRITPPEPHTGVSLQDLAAQVGGLEPGTGVSVVAKDGYAMTFSYDQIVNGDFITYDPGTGDEIEIDAPLQVIIAYERSGEPISPDADGPLRLAVISPENNQVVDGHWTVKWVTEIRLKDMAEDWVLQLEGAQTEEMDRATFESCAAVNCHQATWTDDEGQVWSGVPLWLLAGRIDGGEKHGDDAYNQALAQQGYSLEVIAADGYSAAFDSTHFDHNDDILLANLVDGELLLDKSFPLRVVGADVDKKGRVGQVAQIVAAITAEEAEAAEAAAPVDAWSLKLEGALSLEIGQSDFASCAECHTATWTDDEGQVWTGVSLWRLAGQIDDDNPHDDGAYNQDLAEQGYSLEVVAADGYSAAVESAQFDRVDELLLAYLADGEPLAEKSFPLRLVGPDINKGQMVGQVVQILLQDMPQEAETPASGGEAALSITGAVEQAQALSLDAIKELEVVEVEVEHPKKGRQTYSGVRLNALLDLAGVQTGATKLILTASDGYQTQASLQDMQACQDCLVELDGASLNLIMPGMEGGQWVKDVVEIEIE